MVIEVRDTGIGISPEDLPHIFELFAQADKTLAHSQGGLGIGLTLVRQLVEMHGGTVKASSAGIGYGSTFSVRLPVMAMAVTEIGVEQNEAAISTAKCRILVVDDYADAAESLMMVLKAEGHTVEIASCGMNALEQAQIFLPQIILLDIGLPDLDGYEVAKRLRQLPEHQDTLLIAITGYGSREDIKLAHAAGFNHHLLKPIDFEKLFAMLSMNGCKHSG